MITIELTEDHLHHLVSGAQQFGRCSMLVESTDGDRVIVAVENNHRPGRRRKAATSTPMASDLFAHQQQQPNLFAHQQQPDQSGAQGGLIGRNARAERDVEPA